MGIKCGEKDGFNELMPCELSNDDMAVVTIADKPEHIKAIKKWTVCSLDID